MAFDMNKLVGDVEKLLNGSSRIDIDMNDPQISGILDDLHKARVRLELSHKDIAVDFPQGGSTTIAIRRITAQQKAGPGTPTATKAPEKAAKSPTASPTLKRHQHTYVVPKIAKDMISILTDDASHVVWLTGPTQCLAGETPIRINRGKTGMEWTIEKLYRAHHEKLAGFNSALPTKVRSFMGEKISLQEALDVVYSGRKMVYRMTLADGKSLRLTVDHPVMTRTGFVKAGELTTDSDVMVDNIKTVGSGKNAKEPGRKMFWNLWFHPFAHRVNVKDDSRGYSMRVHQYRIIFEADMNGMALNDFIRTIRTDPGAASKLKFVDPSKFVIHHKNEDYLDNRLSNLEKKSRRDHAIGHDGETHFGQGIPTYSKMVSFVPSEITDVYDIKCPAPYHNFVAGGIVVHNCGKDRLVHHLGRELGRKVFQINCRGDMGSEIFFGEKTVEIDEASKQNKVSFVKGLVEQALTEGLDEQGNEIGVPGILFITEAASMPAHVAIGINRLLESDDTRRTFVIDQDGGRVVRGHSGLRIVLAANTVGRGSTGMEASAYTAQTDALDISLINRIAACFRMGYDREVERHILAEKIGDDRVAALVIKFRDAIRDHIRQGKLTSPFSTAHIVHIADMYRIFGDLGKAIYYVVFEFLMPEEKAIYNETAQLILAKDLLKEFTATGIDYM